MQCLENRSETILHHDRQLQDVLSAVCERHCVYYLCQRARGFSYEKVLALYQDDVLKNDVLMSDFVRRYQRCYRTSTSCVLYKC